MKHVVAILFVLLLGIIWQTASSETLKGQVEEQGVAPVRPSEQSRPMLLPVVPTQKKLRPQVDTSSGILPGNVHQDDLSGSAQDYQSGTLAPQLDKDQNPVLKGTAIKDDTLATADPDQDSQELMIEWDRWRNRFLRAVQLGVTEDVNNPEPDETTPQRFDPYTGTILPRYPLGILTWFYCQVMPDRSIRNIRITKSSGYPNYDAAVRRSIRALEGRSMLDYPRGSRRTVVTQMAGIRTSDTGDFTYHRFGDVEHYTMPQR